MEVKPIYDIPGPLPITWRAYQIKRYVKGGRYHYKAEVVYVYKVSNTQYRVRIHTISWGFTDKSKLLPILKDWYPDYIMLKTNLTPGIYRKTHLIKAGVPVEKK